MQALGLIQSVDAAYDLVQIHERRRPEPNAAATYQAMLPLFASLYDALTPAFEQLHRL